MLPPPATGIHFGARPGWEPGREGRTIDLITPATEDAPAFTVEGVCYLCHDGLTSARMPTLIVCGACGRYDGDHLVEQALAVAPPPPPDTPEQRDAWESLPTTEKYPARRPIPPPKARAKEPHP